MTRSPLDDGPTEQRWRIIRGNTALAKGGTGNLDTGDVDADTVFMYSIDTMSFPAPAISEQHPAGFPAPGGRQ